MTSSYRRPLDRSHPAGRIAVLILSAPIQLYRYALSPALPPACRFVPSCSAYALEALAVHGPIRGLWLAIRRLLRCHPIRLLGGRSGYDPVPTVEARRAIPAERS